MNCLALSPFLGHICTRRTFRRKFATEFSRATQLTSRFCSSRAMHQMAAMSLRGYARFKMTPAPSARPQTGNFLTCFEGFGPQDWSQRRENGRGVHGDRFSGPGDHSGPISGHFRRFRAKPPTCDLNIVTLGQLRLLRLQHWCSGDV